MDMTPSERMVEEAMEAFGVLPVELNQRRIQIPKNNKQISLESATKDIVPFNDGINEARIFIDEITAAYKKINPIETETFYKIIRSKITGTASEVIKDDKTNFHDLIVELNHKYPEPALDWEYELVTSQQQFYENPMHYGKRLQKIIEYSRETNIREASKGEMATSIVLTDDNELKRTALRKFKETLTNDFLTKFLARENPTTLQMAIRLAEILYGEMEWYNKETWNVVCNWEFKCIYCEDQPNHYFDCPFLHLAERY